MTDRVFTEYLRKKVWLARPYVEGEDLTDVKVSDADKKAGSPRAGDMVLQGDNGKLSLVPGAVFAEGFSECLALSAAQPAELVGEFHPADPRSKSALIEAALDAIEQFHIQDEHSKTTAHHLRLAAASWRSRP
jgi:hypothetical protein